jgi:hypothetical protein
VLGDELVDGFLSHGAERRALRLERAFHVRGEAFLERRLEDACSTSLRVHGSVVFVASSRGLRRALGDEIGGGCNIGGRAHVRVDELRLSGGRLDTRCATRTLEVRLELVRGTLTEIQLAARQHHLQRERASVAALAATRHIDAADEHPDGRQTQSELLLDLIR